MPEKVKILIVEDESIVAMDLSTGLENDGYTVAGIADNFDEAIHLFSINEIEALITQKYYKTSLSIYCVQMQEIAVFTSICNFAICKENKQSVLF